ncbi:hypothetical protein H1Q78_02650 [Cellulosimicrobium cellulans]|uniref:hypothetical protein n=1 Tax=Cellulosimicrobium cellulans TaxID=1710 RepID=UPI001ED9FEA1|nr:hypothetical protein [Cellulosimicrobium cellulans]UKJ64365.1 hypothetical protein H1Q78_02650 [Cellulosimicrobium cellulans]
MSVIETWVSVVCPGCGAPARARVLHIIAWGAIPGSVTPHQVSIMCEHLCIISGFGAKESVRVCPHCRVLMS